MEHECPSKAILPTKSSDLQLAKYLGFMNWLFWTMCIMVWNFITTWKSLWLWTLAHSFKKSYAAKNLLARLVALSNWTWERNIGLWSKRSMSSQRLSSATFICHCSSFFSSTNFPKTDKNAKQKCLLSAALQSNFGQLACGFFTSTTMLNFKLVSLVGAACSL